MSFLDNLRQGLSKSRKIFGQSLGAIITKRRLDTETLQNLEDALITADLGVQTAQDIVATLKTRKIDKELSETEIKTLLADEICARIAQHAKPFILPAAKPAIILVSGVNGAGKTTSIGKLAQRWQKQGKRILIAAGDTYRAAAQEQLAIWSARARVDIFTAQHDQQDPSALVYEAIAHAKAEGFDIVLIDTAGRLHSNDNLMDELRKMIRVIKKHDADAPHASLLVLDATIGQNAIIQAETFLDAAQISGLIMAKLDNTSRGGVLVAIAARLQLPIHFIGVGESGDDLLDFNAPDFAHALVF